MAARETQVLHIALIIFVGLTVVLFVVSFFIFRSYQEEQLKVKASETALTAQKKDSRELALAAESLKKVIGAANTDTVETIEANFKKDMQKYAPAFPEDKQTYRNLIEYLQTQFVSADQGRIQVAAEVKQLKDQLAKLDQDRLAEVKKFSDAQKASDLALAEEREKFNKDRTKLEADKTEQFNKSDASAKLIEENVKKRDEEIVQLKARIVKLETANQGFRDQKKKEVDSSELADGEVRWINQRTRSVWINRGSDDKLPRQISFSVVGKDETNMATAKKKGKLEVVHILDRHLAEARIVEDRYEDPIMPGDLIFTPIWEPNQRQHFALAGFMDLDGDGLSDRAKIKELIAHADGIIDAEATDDGKKVGQISANTRYLIMGDQPTDKTKPDVQNAMNAVLKEASEFGIRTLSMQDFLDQIGYKAEAKTVLLGKEGDDFAQRKEARKNAKEKQEALNPPAPETKERDEFQKRLPHVKKSPTY